MRRKVTPSRRAVLATLVLAGCGGAVHAARSKASPTAAESAPAPSGAPTTPAPVATTAAPSASGGPAIEIVNGSRTTPQVALTFHGNGDPALAEALLRAAEAKGAHITVFAVGNWLAANPALGRPDPRRRPRPGESHLHPPRPVGPFRIGRRAGVRPGP